MASNPAEKTAAATRIIADWPCPFCSCLCDDLQLTVDGERIISVEDACPIADRRIAQIQAVTSFLCRIAGEPVQRDIAVRRTAELLSQSRRPLIYGLSGVSVEAQRISIALAERLGGVIDPSGNWNSLHALQSIGEVTATLGEIRSRADLIVVWNADPVATHPRFIANFSPRRVAGGNRELTLTSIGEQRTETASLADQFLTIRPDSDCAGINVLRALVSELPLDVEQVSLRTGVALTDWKSLADRLKQAKYAAIIYDSGRNFAAARQFTEALHALVRDLNATTRCVSLHLSAGENLVGAENVLAWQSGFARAVDFARGFPRFDPAIYTAEKLLEQRAVDLMMIVGEESLDQFCNAARQHIESLPTIVIDWRETELLRHSEVSLPVAPPGVATGGTYFRCDGVPLTLRPAIESELPSDCEALAEIVAALDKLGE